MIPPETPLGEIGERALLRHIRSRIPEGTGVVVGVGDDAAVVETSALTLVTTDSLVEEVHFRREWAPAALIGRKALAVNLSDVAAMAGVPRHATVSLCLPPDLPFSFVDGLYDGLLERAAEAGVGLIGGNLARGPVVVVDVTVLGYADRVLRRSGALPGDLAVVTGALGAAAEGLRLLAQGARLDAEGQVSERGVWTESSTAALHHCLKAQLDPSPRLALGRAIAEQELAHAAIDVSDGLSGDLLEICLASELSAWVDAEKIPVDPHAAGLERARGGEALPLALHGGEDYELLLAVPPDKVEALQELAAVWGLGATAVGEFAEGAPSVSLKRGDELTLLVPISHDHFRVPFPRGGSGAPGG